VKSKIVPVLLPFCLLLLSAAAPLEVSAAGSAGKPVFRLGAEAGYLSGSTTYRISLPTAEGLLESELDWPLDSWMLGLRASYERPGHWALDVVVRTNLTEETGTLEDSDIFQGTTFVFSESDSTMDAFSALVIDAGGRYTFHRRKGWSLGGVLGFLYEEFDLTGSNVNQFSPLGIPGLEGSAAGPVITYSVSYSIPYAGLSLGLQPTPAFTVDIDVLAGYGFADDEDDHLLRLKLARAEADGPAFMVRARGAYSLTRSWSLTASVDLLKADLSGEQSQIFYGGPDAGSGFVGIDDDIETRQVTFTAGAQYRF